MRAVSDAMLPAIRQLVAEAGVVEALVRPLVYPRLRATYEAAGSPYGPAEDAMWRWWRDVAAAVREAAQEQGERAWETGLTELRRRIEAKRGP
jgi:hypothetical protein